MLVGGAEAVYRKIHPCSDPLECEHGDWRSLFSSFPVHGFDAVQLARDKPVLFQTAPGGVRVAVSQAGEKGEDEEPRSHQATVSPLISGFWIRVLVFWIQGQNHLAVNGNCGRTRQDPWTTIHFLSFMSRAWIAILSQRAQLSPKLSRPRRPPSIWPVALLEAAVGRVSDYP